MDATQLLPLLLAILLSCALLGGMLAFAFSHSIFRPFVGGRLQKRRALVAFVLSLQVIITTFDIVRAWKVGPVQARPSVGQPKAELSTSQMYAIHFGDTRYYQAFHWEGPATLTLGVIIQALAQLFLLERAFALSHVLRVSRRVVWLATVFGVLAILSGCGAGLAVIAWGNIVGVSYCLTRAPRSSSED